MRVTIALLATLCQFGSVRLSAQDAFKVEYICGKSGFNHKMKGQLVVTDSLIRFVGTNDSLVFAIPMKELGDVLTNAGGMALLGFCTSKGELVFLYTEARGTVEAIAFKTERGISSAIVARIHAMTRSAPVTRPDR